MADLVLRYMDREERPAGTAMQYRSYHKTIAAAFPIPAAQFTDVLVAAAVAILFAAAAAACVISWWPRTWRRG